MLELHIQDKEGGATSHTLVNGVHTLGKAPDCDIVLSDVYASRHHANLTVSDSGIQINDAGSKNGIWIQEERIQSNYTLNDGESFRIGNLTLTPVRSKLKLVNKASDGVKKDAKEAPINKTPEEIPRLSKIVDNGNGQQLQEFKRNIHQLVLEYLDLHKRGSLHSMSAEELREEASRAAYDVIEKKQIQLPAGIDIADIIREIVAEAIGLGPLEPLLEDSSITEIMANGADQIYVERYGKLQLSDAVFHSEESLMSIIERIVTPLGRRIDEGSPMVDARLTDGSRVNAIIRPLSLVGPILTIRKFSKKRLSINDLIDKGSLSSEMASFLEVCVRTRKNIIVSGGTGSGKTTTLNILSNFIPGGERIVTIEDAAELQLHQEHVVSLESRPANIEGKGQVSIRDLVKNALRMRPDRIVVGECRGGEALDMLQAMNTGHDGSMTTGHANTPRDFLSRLEVMVLMSGIDLPVRAIREQIASAVDIIIQISRFNDGKRRITDIVEVDGMEGDVILMQKIFQYKQMGRDAEGIITGSYMGCGYAPTFYHELELIGEKLDRGIFGESQALREAKPDWE